MTAKCGGDQFFLVTLNVEGKVGLNLAAGSRRNSRIDGEWHIAGQVDVNISHAGFELRGAKGFPGAVQLRQNASRPRGSAYGAFNLKQVNAAACRLRHYAAARAVHPDAASGSFGSHAASGG